MNYSCRLVFCAILLTLTNNAWALVIPPIHLDGEDYRPLLKMQGLDMQADELQPNIKMGERLYDWIKHINESRSAPLSLSSAASQPATPITSPKFNNRQILLERAKEFRASVPLWFKNVIFDNADFTDSLPVAEDEFLDWGRQADSLYSLTARWLLQEPYLYAYEMRKKNDVRGIYHLSHTADLESILADWNALPSDQQITFKDWLVNICENTTSTAACKKSIATAISSQKVYEYYLKYQANSQRTWTNYFHISGERSDVEWTVSNPNEFHIPFTLPEESSIENYLRDNIEDEYKWLGWRLILDFVTGGSDTPNVVFEPGVTPHVDCLGCSRITMDANVPITDYTVQWTIRHEFGHVLGFPDCYVEFFDSELSKMVYYQLDVDNLMCSRRGKFSQTHFDEMRRVYFTKQSI